MTPRLERLLAMVADRPHGAKVHIPSLVRAFTPTQSETIAAINALIQHGHLDAVTLRRTVDRQTCAETQTDKKCLSETLAEASKEAEPTEPPAPRAVEQGGGAARFAKASPPTDLGKLLDCFGEEFETLRLIAQRFGADSPQRIVRHTRSLHEKGLIEQAAPTNGQPFCLWRRAGTIAGPLSLPRDELAALPPKLVEELSPAARAQVHAAQDQPSGAELAAQLEDYVETHGLAKSAVGMRLFKNTNGIGVLRSSRQPRPVTIEKVRAFMAADPPPDLKRHQGVGPGRATKPEAPLGDRRYAANRKQPVPIPSAGPAGPVDPPASPTVESVAVPDDSPEPRPALEQSPPKVDIKVNAPARRDPTQPPDLPLTEMRDRQISRGFAHAAAVRRGHEKTATDLLDAGVDPSSQSSNVANKMREVERRRVEEARLLDPVEQAKTIIRQAGWNCFDAGVTGGPADMFRVGNKLQTKTELLAFAEQLRTTRGRRA